MTVRARLPERLRCAQVTFCPQALQFGAFAGRNGIGQRLKLFGWGFFPLRFVVSKALSKLFSPAGRFLADLKLFRLVIQWWITARIWLFFEDGWMC
ncbi:hypothetical protein [Serratia marcescens]|uniref:hypothetical protein n=1 Tax=Serratia marcescens TaxID=615 RepID=UPI001BCB06AD|nr:hypothetical protein [Serratia marcescens]